MSAARRWRVSASRKTAAAALPRIGSPAARSGVEAAFAGKARAPKRGWRPLSGAFHPPQARLAFPSRTPGRRRRPRGIAGETGCGLLASPSRGGATSCLAGRRGRRGGPVQGILLWAGEPHASPRRRPPVAAAALTPAAPRMSNACTKRPAHAVRGEIDEESALPIEAIASRRLSRPIGAQPHRLIERVSGRVSDPLGNSLQARASRARPPCSRASPSNRALPPPSMRSSKMRAPTGCERSNTPCRS